MSKDAKTAWLDQVKQHKRKQKGLPALSSINTDAGNVEHNIEVFNNISSARSCNEVNTSSDVAMGESFKYKDLDDTFDMSMRTLL